jgi:hypothetical protein
MRRIGPSWHRLGSRSGTSPPPHRSPHDEPGFMFEELERFVAAHRTCGELIGDVGEISEGGCTLLACLLVRRRLRAMRHARDRRS